jgi:hypothetical protein
MTKLEKEFIPDEDKLYCFIHQANVNYKTGKPRAAAFQNTPKTGDNLSCDWSKYTTPEETRLRVGKQFKAGTTEFKNPDLYGVVSLNVGIMRFPELGQRVEHDPIFNTPEITGQPNNVAHSIIIGEKDEEIRLKMVDYANWLIPPPLQS